MPPKSGLTMWCKHCKRLQSTYCVEGTGTGTVCCGVCGRVHRQFPVLRKIYSSELKGCLNTEAETRFKTIIWEHLNQQAEDQRAALAKLRKERQQKRKSTKAVEKGLEETSEAVIKKRLSSKVNYDVLEKLLNDDDNDDSFSDPKKRRVGSEDVDSTKHGLGDKEDETATIDNTDEVDLLQDEGTDDEFNDEYADEQYEIDLF